MARRWVWGGLHGFLGVHSYQLGQAPRVGFPGFWVKPRAEVVSQDFECVILLWLAVKTLIDDDSN